MRGAERSALAKGEAPLRQPTSEETVTIQCARSSQATRPARALISRKVGDSGGVVLSNPHADGEGWWATLQETFGTTSPEFVNDAISKLTVILGKCDAGSEGEKLNASLALIAGIAPENEAQAAIAVQIAASHAASIQMTSRALLNANAGHVEAAAVFANMGTKLSRTMVAQVEALTKLRGGGRQVIEHRYINVNGNAVVGDHAQAVFGGNPQPQGGQSESAHQPREPIHILDEPGPSLPCSQSAGNALPGASNAGAKEMPTSRRQEPGRAQGIRQRTVRAREED